MNPRHPMFDTLGQPSREYVLAYMDREFKKALEVLEPAPPLLECMKHWSLGDWLVVTIPFALFIGVISAVIMVAS